MQSNLLDDPEDNEEDQSSTRLLDPDEIEASAGNANHMMTLFEQNRDTRRHHEGTAQQAIHDAFQCQWVTCVVLALVFISLGTTFYEFIYGNSVVVKILVIIMLFFESIYIVATAPFIPQFIIALMERKRTEELNARLDAEEAAIFAKIKAHLKKDPTLGVKKTDPSTTAAAV